MSKVVFGEVDWNSGDVGSIKSDFMRLEQGKTKVRVMGNPTQFYVHWVESPDGKKKKVNSPVSDPALVKRLEDAGFKRKATWIVTVLDRSDDTFKLLEIGSQIYNSIKNLYLDEDWGPVGRYDLTIERGTPGTQPLYRVTPRPKAPLSSELAESFKEFSSRVDLTKLIQPSEPDDVRKMLGWGASSSAKDTSSLVDDDMFAFSSPDED